MREFMNIVNESLGTEAEMLGEAGWKQKLGAAAAAATMAVSPHVAKAQAIDHGAIQKASSYSSIPDRTLRAVVDANTSVRGVEACKVTFGVAHYDRNTGRMEMVVGMYGLMANPGRGVSIFLMMPGYSSASFVSDEHQVADAIFRSGSIQLFDLADSVAKPAIFSDTVKLAFGDNRFMQPLNVQLDRQASEQWRRCVDAWLTTQTGQR